MTPLRIGAGAGYSGDRLEPAVELARHGELDYLIFECLAERTIALAQQARLADPLAGYDPLLATRMRAVLPYLRQGGRRLRIITNMGAANPRGAMRKVLEIASELGLHGLKVAAVEGDDVLATLRAHPEWTLDNGLKVAELGERLVSANAYLGIEGIVQALELDADVIITGRVADPSLFLAAQAHAFGWAADDWLRRGRGTLTGHLLECAGQVSGGYFADPGVKDVPDLARLGFPLAEIDRDGHAQITKVACSGGRIDVATCTEQLLYEVHDPRSYLTPDVTADFSAVTFTPVAADRIAVSGATGRERPEHLKVTVGYRDGWIGEGQLSYGGPNAVARARLAGQIVEQRLALSGVQVQELRCELLGVDSLHSSTFGHTAEPWEVRLRVTGRCATRELAQALANEVETLYTNGPAGGGGATRQVREVLAVASLYLPREQAIAHVDLQVSP